MALGETDKIYRRLPTMNDSSDIPFFDQPPGKPAPSRLNRDLVSADGKRFRGRERRKKIMATIHSTPLT